jgi:hypothetical protein
MHAFIRRMGFALAALSFASSVAWAAMPVKGDANCDGAIGAADIAAIVAGIGEPPGACVRVDVDTDGEVTPADLTGELGIVFPRFEEFVATAGDFACLTDWPRIRHFRITNALGHLDEALAVANGEQPLPYPPGTIIQLFPLEASVKRGGSFDLDNGNWEFFVLDPSSGETVIRQRGREEVANAPIPCFSCHSAARDFDFVCETTHGCIPLNLGEELIDLLQDSDVRCAGN